MATDLEKLVVSLSADIKGYERNLNKALGITNNNARRIERRYNQMSRTVSSSLGRVGAVIGGALSVRGAQQLIDSSTRITNALKVAGLEGEKLNVVYETLFASAQRNAAPLESLVTLYGRAAIVQKELGVSSEELLKFTDNVALALRVAGTDAQSASGALLQLSQALGSGTVRAEEFNSILEGALPVAQAAAAGLEEAGGSVAKLRGLIIDGKVSSEAFFRAFEAGSVILQDKVASSQLTVSQGFTKIYNAAIDAAGKLNEGSQAGNKVSASLDRLALSIKQADFGPLISGISTAVGVATQLANILGKISDLSAKAGQAVGADKLIPWLRGDDLVIENTEKRGQSGMVTPVPTPAPRPVRLGDFAPPPGAEKGGKKSDSWQRETRQIQEATAALQVELGLIGQTEFARDKARAALELENAARRAGITDIEQHRTKIDELSTSYAMAAESVRQAEDRFAAINEIQRVFGEAAIDGITGLIDGTKTLNDVLADTLKRFADMALQAAFLGDGPLAGLFGGRSASGGVGGIIGALFGGFRASGGPVSGNKAYMVGERGPELMVPRGAGTIVPNEALRSRGGGGQPVQIVMNNDFRGVDAGSRAYIESRLAQTERRAVAAAVAAIPGAVGKRPAYLGSGR